MFSNCGDANFHNGNLKAPLFQNQNNVNIIFIDFNPFQQEFVKITYNALFKVFNRNMGSFPNMKSYK